MGTVQVLLIYFALLNTLDASSSVIPKETDTATFQRVQLTVIRNHAVDIVRNNFTSNQYCKAVAVNLLQNLTTVEASCGVLCAAKGAVRRYQQCSEHDYNLLNDALCSHYTCPTHAPAVPTQSPEDLKKLVENVMCVVDNELSTDMCGNEIRRLSEGGYDPERACRILQSFHLALGVYNCTTEDYQKLFRVICEKQLVPCSPVTSLLRNLTSSCRGVMNASLNQLFAPGGACNFLDSQKQHITSNSICTAGDFVKLHQLLCLTNSSLSQAIHEGQQVEKAEETIKTKLTKTCQDSLWPEFQKHGLLEFCQIIEKSGTSLVSEGVCTLKDIDLLKPVLCFGHTEHNVRDQKQKDEIHSTIETLSSRCNAAMLAFEKKNQGVPRKASCKELNADRDTLIITNTCNEGEITKVSNLLCSHANTFRSHWITALLICLALNEIYFPFSYH